LAVHAREPSPWRCQRSRQGIKPADSRFFFTKRKEKKELREEKVEENIEQECRLHGGGGGYLLAE
jgi:hypothetical protein